jgi:hypothetical protein
MDECRVVQKTICTITPKLLIDLLTLIPEYNFFETPKGGYLERDNLQGGANEKKMYIYLRNLKEGFNLPRQRALDHHSRPNMIPSLNQ